MAKIETFEDMEVWQQARGLVKHIYDLTSRDAFAKDFALRDQIRRASISVMSNIAEGFERSSNKEFTYFLGISKASAAEVRSQLYVAHDLKYLDDSTFQVLKEKLVSVSRQLSAFIKYLSSNSRKKL
jgi:four helix bundle protein